MDRRNALGTQLRYHEEEGKDKRNDFNRTLDMCTELNDIVKTETHKRDILTSQIKGLESDRVVLLQNNDKYT